MTNINKLRGRVVERNMTIEELAREIGIDRSTMYRKFKSQGEDFSIKEANLIVEALELNKDEAMAIFFTQLVA